MKHTPGPWRDIAARTDCEIRLYLIYAGGEPVASIERTDSGSDKANARLIAAAPDMLAALSAILFQASRGTVLERDACVAQARDAMRKAIAP